MLSEQVLQNPQRGRIRETEEVFMSFDSETGDLPEDPRKNSF